MTDWVWVPFEVEPQFDGYRVDRFLSRRLAAYSRARIQRILADSRVMRKERLMKASGRVRRGEQILLAYPRRVEAQLLPGDSIPILFEDDTLLVVNKPPDLLSHPTGKVSQRTVIGLLRHSRPDVSSFFLLHRLDRDTSGVLAVGKTRAVARAWTQLMERREVQKEYVALVRGLPKPRRGTLNQPIGRAGGKIHVQQAVEGIGAVAAVTRYEVIGSKENVSFVRASPETGRLHQIRVHLAALGHPILGDALYTGDGSLYLKMTEHRMTIQDRESLGFPRLALHAARLRFPHPITGKMQSIAAPMPADIADFLKDRQIGKIDTLIDP